MTDDEGKSGDMVRKPGEDERDKDGTLLLEGRKVAQTAPNVIIGKHCSACDKDVSVDNEGIQCRLCKDVIHAINCVANEIYWVCSPSSFTGHILPVVNKKKNEKTGKRRAGNFWFVCDCCSTDVERRSTISTMDKVEVLEQRMVSVENNLRDEISELKNLIIGMDKSSVSSSFVAPDSPGSLSSSIRSESKPENVTNVWNDSQRVDNLKHLVAVKKTNTGEKVDPRKLEKIIVDNRIKVHKTFELKKSTDTGLVVNSKEDADFLIKKIEDELPQHKTSLVSNRIPSVTIVGLEREFTNNELMNMIVQQNPGIGAIKDSNSTTPEDGVLDIVKVQPLRNNPNVFKAIVRVSNLIRSVIAKQGDRLFMGQKTCKVYDFVFTLRCYKCQVFDHHSKDCTNEPACAHCAGDHETRNCEKKSVPEIVKCKNCSDAGKSDTAHEASSYACPMFLDRRLSIMKTIPFHQVKKLGTWGKP